MTGKRGNPIHGLGKRKFYERKWVVELIAVGPPILAAAVAVYIAWAKNDAVTFVLICGCVWLIGASIVKVVAAKAQDSKDDAAKGHDGLVASLQVVHSVVALAGKLVTPEEQATLRVTFHRVVPPLEESEHIEHIVRYVGGRGSDPGRKFSIRSGITGRAIREKAVFVMARQSDNFEDYVNELVSEWSYTEADARRMTMDRYSAMALPVRGRGQEVLGVLYLDSSSKNFFASDDIQQTVTAACVGVANYIGERYV